MLSSLNQLDKVAFTFKNTGRYCLFWILREMFILYNEVMQIITEVVSTCRASMTVEHSEEANLRPFDIQMGLTLRFQYVENDGDTVFVILTDNALISICCI